MHRTINGKIESADIQGKRDYLSSVREKGTRPPCPPPVLSVIQAKAGIAGLRGARSMSGPGDAGSTYARA